jgi:hypothetical protein
MIKAKHIAKLRKKARYYDVGVTRDMFGYNSLKDDFGGTVLARSYKEAVRRYLKRNQYLEQRPSIYSTTKRWCKYFVKRSAKVDHFRHYRFYK